MRRPTSLIVLSALVGCASLFAVRPAVAAEDDAAKLAGVWNLQSAVSGGKATDAKSFERTHFSTGQVLLNRTRKLWFRLIPGSTPARMQIFNKVGDREVNLYACVYQVDGDKLTLTFNAGDDFPASLKSDKKEDWSTEMHFKKGE